MDGKRAVLMVTDPPYLVNYDGGNHPPSWGKDGGGSARRPRPSIGTTTRTPSTRSSFYAAFLGAARAEALTERPALYQFFGDDAHRDRPGGLARQRPACPPGG